jgi:hypothetical protein
MTPIEYLCSQIPTRVLEYALKCPLFCRDKYIEHGRFLHVYGMNRGILDGAGMANYSECAKTILKRYTGGELLFVQLPPNDFLEFPDEGLKKYQFNQIPDDYVQTTPESIKIETEKEYIEEEKKVETGVDAEYFQPEVDIDEILSNLTQDDIIKLIMGTKINGVRLDKLQRRELKFAIKRDASSEEIEVLLSSYLKANYRSNIVNVRKVYDKKHVINSK